MLIDITISISFVFNQCSVNAKFRRVLLYVVFKVATGFWVQMLDFGI